MWSPCITLCITVLFKSISADFAWKVSGVVNGYLVNEYKEKLAATQQALITSQQKAINTTNTLNVVQDQLNQSIAGWMLKQYEYINDKIASRYILSCVKIV